MLNLVVVLQLLTIILSPEIILSWRSVRVWRDVEFLDEGLGSAVLRYKQPGKRDFRVPLNFTMGNVEIPVGLA